MITEYIVIRTRDSQELEMLLNEKIGEGYEPQGGIPVIPYFRNDDGFNFLYHQAMIKREDL